MVLSRVCSRKAENPFVLTPYKFYEYCVCRIEDSLARLVQSSSEEVHISPQDKDRDRRF